MVKSLCNAKFTVDVTPFFAFFVLIFVSAYEDVKILFSSLLFIDIYKYCLLFIYFSILL